MESAVNSVDLELYTDESGAHGYGTFFLRTSGVQDNGLTGIIPYSCGDENLGQEVAK